MALNFKKALLTGTALVMAGAFAGQANAAALTLTADGIWASAGTRASSPTTNVNTAASGDTVAISGTTTLTFTNNGTASDTAANTNTFTTGAITTSSGTSNLILTTGSANDLSVVMAAGAFTGATTISNQDANNASVLFTVNGAFSTTGALQLTNTETTAAKTVAAVYQNTLSAGATTITGGTFAGANTTVTAAGNASFSGAVAVNAGTGGAAGLTLNGVGTQTFSSTLAISGGANAGGQASVVVAGNLTSGAITVTPGAAGTASLNLKGATNTATSIALGNNGTNYGLLTLSGTSAQALTGNVTGTGNVVVATSGGAATFNGTVAGNSIKLDSGAGTASVAVFKNTVNSTSGIVVGAATGAATNTLTLDATTQSFAVTGAISAANTANTDNLVIAGGTGKTVTLNTAMGANIDSITVNADTTLASGTLVAPTITLNAASIINLASSANITGDVNLAATRNGTLNFAGTNVMTGNIGASGTTGLAAVNFNNTTGNAVSVTGNAYATNLNVTTTGTSTIQGATTGAVNISGTGTLVSYGTVTGDTAFTADGKLTVGNSGGVGAGIVGNVGTNAANTGTLAFVGTGTNTVSGTVGATNALKVVSVGAGNVTFQNATFAAQSLSFTGAGTANLVASGTSVNGQAIAFAGNNGSVVFGNGVNYSGTSTTTSTGTGNMTFGTGSTISGAVGTNGNKMNTISLTGGANTISSSVHATKVDVANATVNVTNTAFDSGVNFSNNAGQITFASASTVTGNITATTAGDGTIVYTGPLNITGDIGRIKSFNVAGTLGVTGNMIAADAMNVGIENVNVNGTFGTTANTSLVYRVNTPTTSGKITSTGNATVDAGTAVNMVVDTSVFVANGQQFVLIDGNNAGTGVATLTAGKLTTTSTTLLKFKQDITNTHDLVVVADRTASSTIATSPSNAAVGTVLDALGGSSNPQINALNVALGAATTSTQVDNLLSSVVAPTDTSIAATSTSSATIANVITAHIDAGSSGTISMPGFGGESKESGKSGGNDAMSRNVWFQGFGASADQGVRNGAAGYDVGSYGAVIGADKEVNDNFRMGVNLAYAKTNVNGRDINRTGTDVDSYQGGVYGGYDFGNGYFATGQLSYMYSDMETVRYAVGGVPGQNARANPHSSMYSARTEAGRAIAVPHGFTLTPSALANFSYTDMSKYSETGAGGLSLSNVNPDDPRMVELGLRMKAEARIDDTIGGQIKPALTVGYRYDLIGDRASTVAGLVGGGTAFTTTGAKPARGTAEAGAGVTWVSPYNVDVTAEYDYEHKSQYNAHSGFVRAGMKF